MNGKNTGSDMQLIVFRLGNEEFGADIAQVREVIRTPTITPIPQAFDYVQGVINFRDRVIMVVNLRRWLRMPERSADDNSRIVVVEADTGNVGIMVDSVTEVKNVNGGQVEPFSGFPAGDKARKYILGVCKLDDRLLILVDLKKVCDEVVSSSAAALTQRKQKHHD
jgi:purine-binding chemotaxis protein CheW